MELMKEFRDISVDLIDRILSEEESVASIVEVLADAIEDDRLIHVFGTGGHSSMGAMEIFYRAGGLACINPLFPPGMSNMDSHPSTERLTGYAEYILSHYQVEEGDPLLVVNVNGINPVTIEAAMEGQERGAKVIAITSREFASNVPDDLPARHPNNKNLHELGDLVLDVHVPVGDAVLEVEGFEQKVSAISTVLTAFALQGLVGETVRELVDRGVEPPVWKSANVPGGDEANAKYLDKYFDRVQHLYRYE